MSQKKQKETRKLKKEQDKLIKTAMYAYCIDFCKKNNINYDELDQMQKIALVRHSQGVIEKFLKAGVS